MKYQISHLIFFALLLTFSYESYGQIEISKESTEKVKEEKKEELAAAKSTSDSEFFLSANWSSSSRLLRENVGLYGDPLNERGDESTLGIWSFGIGFRSQVKPHLAWEGGISFLRNGESYLFEASDSMFSYQTRYAYIAMPVKAYYTLGKDLKFYAGGGLIPQMFLQYNQDQKWTTATNTPGEASIKQRNGFAPVVLSLVASIGIQANMGNSWNVFVFPEYRYQLTNSYVVTDSYEHFGRSLGVSFGFSRGI